MKLRPLAQPYLFCQIRSGNLALFCHDDWTGLGSLIDLTGEFGPRISGLPLLSTVSQPCVNGGWSLPRSQHSIMILLRACLPLTVPDTSSMEDDYFLWRNSIGGTPGMFSTSKIWISLNPISSATVPWYKSVWCKERIPKHSFMSWIILRDRLPTRDRLRGWEMSIPSDSLLCGSSLETKSHLFVL